MATCFCGCGDDIKRFGPRGANAMGHKTVPVNDRLRAARILVLQRDAEGVYERDVHPIIAHIEQHLAQGAEWEAFWAYYAHGGQMYGVSAYKKQRREWYEWTKEATTLATIARLTPDEARAVKYGGVAL